MCNLYFILIWSLVERKVSEHPFQGSVLIICVMNLKWHKLDEYATATDFVLYLIKISI